MLNIWVVEDNKQYVNDLMRNLQLYSDQLNRKQSIDLSIHCVESDYLAKVNDILENDSSASNVFIMDIDLHESYNGIQIAKNIREKDKRSNIIFVTSHIELVSRIFIHNLKVVTFIDKMDPYFKERLFSALDTVVEEESLSKDVTTETKADTRSISYHYKGHYYRIPYDEILGIETNPIKRGLVINTIDKSYPCRFSMKSIMDKLSNEFIQIHRSIVLNAKYVREIKSEDSSYTVVMKNGSTYPASNKYVGNVIEFMNAW